MKRSISTQTAVFVIAVVIIVVGLFYMRLVSPNQDAKHKDDLIAGSVVQGKPNIAAPHKVSTPM